MSDLHTYIDAPHTSKITIFDFCVSRYFFTIPYRDYVFVIVLRFRNLLQYGNIGIKLPFRIDNFVILWYNVSRRYKGFGVQGVLGDKGELQKGL